MRRSVARDDITPPASATPNVSTRPLTPSRTGGHSPTRSSSRTVRVQETDVIRHQRTRASQVTDSVHRYPLQAGSLSASTVRCMFLSTMMQSFLSSSFQSLASNATQYNSRVGGARSVTRRRTGGRGALTGWFRRDDEVQPVRVPLLRELARGAELREQLLRRVGALVAVPGVLPVQHDPGRRRRVQARRLLRLRVAPPHRDHLLPVGCAARRVVSGAVQVCLKG